MHTLLSLSLPHPTDTTITQWFVIEPPCVYHMFHCAAVPVCVCVCVCVCVNVCVCECLCVEQGHSTPAHNIHMALLCIS